MKKVVAILFFITLVNETFAQNALFKIDSILKKAYTQKALNGSVLIAKEGKTIFDKNYGFADFEKKTPISNNTQFQIASVSKQFTAFGIMVLKNEGKIDYKNLVVKFLPKFPYKNVTLLHLLQHTSGLPDFWNNIRPFLDTTKSNGNKEMLSLLYTKNLPLQFEPGEKWEYSDIGYDILATIIEEISGMTYEKFMRKKVFEPALLKNTQALMVTNIQSIKSKKLARGYIKDSINDNQLAHKVKNYVFFLGDFYGDGSVISTTRDLKKWDDALYRYIQQDSMHFSEAYNAIRRKDGSVLEIRAGLSYGFGWNLRNDSLIGKTYSHSGKHPGFSTYFFRFPDKKVTLVMCMNIDNKIFEPYLKAVRNLLPFL